MVSAAWVSVLILSIEGASSPRRLPPEPPDQKIFGVVAEHIAKESTASPVFTGEHGAEQTAALLVALFHFESGNDPKAVGDCSPKETTKFGTCMPGARGHSFGLGQINDSNFKGLGIKSSEDFLGDVGLQVRTSLRMMKSSFAICRTRPLEERAAWYVEGSDGCPTSDRAAKLSRHRIGRGIALYKAHPPVPLSP